MKFYLAPMEGITGHIYRNSYEKYFHNIDKYFTPFIVPNQSVSLKTKELKDLLPQNNKGLNIVPQILTNDADGFILTANKLKQLGYEEINLNLGCPAGTVVSKKRGSGFLAYPEELDKFLDEIYKIDNMKISIKTRLGKERADEFYKLIEIYNNKVTETEKIKYGNEVCSKYLNGDINAEESVNEWINNIVTELMAITVFYNPEIICLGGGISEEDWFIEKVKNCYKEKCIEYLEADFITTEIGRCKYNNDATILGAIINSNI